ncbi:hypothetical protein HMSSN036_15620 [Paenibacillus macerans]|nr:hypothetical protein HMSSN036_15620 [Paenibacillus macerans]
MQPVRRSRCRGRRFRFVMRRCVRLLRNVAFGVDHGDDLAYAEHGAVGAEHFLNRTVNRTRHFHDRFVVLHFHNDIFVGYFVARFDVHFNNFALMQTFPKLRETIFKFSHRK